MKNILSLLLISIFVSGCSMKNEEIKTKNTLKIKTADVETVLNITKDKEEIKLNNITYSPIKNEHEELISRKEIESLKKSELRRLAKSGNKVDIEYAKKEDTRDKNKQLLILIIDVEKYNYNEENDIQETTTYSDVVVLEKNKEYKIGTRTFLWNEN